MVFFLCLRLSYEFLISLFTVVTNIREVSPELSEARYRAAWRLGVWSLNDTKEVTAFSDCSSDLLDVVFGSFASSADGRWEELIFHLRQAVARQDWLQVRSLVENKW